MLSCNIVKKAVGLLLSVGLVSGVTAVSDYPHGVAFANNASSVPPSSSRYEKALASISAGKNQTAIILLKNELKENADNVAARLLLGKLYVRMGEGDAAERELRMARQKGADPDLILKPLGDAYLLQNTPKRVIDEILPGYRQPDIEAQVQVLRGRAYLRLQKYSDAENSFYRAAELDSHSIYALIGLAGVQVEQRHYAEALNFINDAVAIDKTSTDVLTTRGDILRLSGALDQAIKDYDYVLEVKPDAVGVRLGRASILIDQGKYDAAKTDIEYVLEKAPYNPKAKYMLAAVLGAQGDKEGADEALGDAAAILKAISPKELSVQRETAFLGGMVAFKRGNYEDARKYLNFYTSLEPSDPRGQRLLAATQIKLGNNSDAIDGLRNVVLEKPDDVAGLSLLGRAYLAVEDQAHAIDALQRALQLKPDLVADRLRLGQAYRSLKNYDRAIEAFTMAAKQVPEAVEPKALLVSTYLEADRDKDAVATVKDLLAHHPDNSHVLNLAGVAYRQTGQYQKAKADFGRAVAVEPDYLPAALNLAYLQLHLQEFDQAEASFQSILGHDRKNIQAMLGMGDTARARHQASQAGKWYERARLAAPSDPAPWERLVDLKLSNGDPEGAVSLGQDYVSKYPKNYSVRKALGIAQVKAGKLVEAEKTYHTLVDLSPDRAISFYQLAVVRQMAKNSEGARQALLNALAWNGKYTEAFIALIQLEAKAGNLENMENLGKQLDAISPVLASAALGKAYFSIGRFDKSITAYKAGLDESPENWTITAGLYKALLRGGQGDTAIALMEDWRRVHPADMSAELLMASGYLKTGQMRKAIPIYEKLLAVSPDNPGYLNDLAWAYLKVRDNRALEYARRAFNLAPNSASVADTLAWILVRTGKAGQALPLLRQAQARDSSNPQISYHLAAALEALGRDDEALTEARKALNISAQFDGADKAQAMVRRLSGSQGLPKTAGP